MEALAGPADDLGVTFSALKGTGRVRPLSTVLVAARRYARFPVLVLDREGDIERDIELLKRDGVVTEEAVFLWDASIEEDNFTHDELVQVAQAIAASMGAELQLTAERLREAYESQRSRLGNKAQGLAEILLRLCRHPNHGAVRIAKPELVEGLKNLLLAELNEDEEEAQLFLRRPVVKLVFNIIRVT